MARHRTLQERSTDKAGGSLSAQRNMIDGRALRAIAEAQAKADALHPVAVQASLRDLVIAFEPLIQARKDARWANAEICAWQSQLSYEISPDTLRTCRSQLGIGVNVAVHKPLRAAGHVGPTHGEVGFRSAQPEAVPKHAAAAWSPDEDTSS